MNKWNLRHPAYRRTKTKEQRFKFKRKVAKKQSRKDVKNQNSKLLTANCLLPTTDYLLLRNKPPQAPKGDV
jgi:hypothetical protein